MLVELAIGDAYGAGFEYSPAEFVAEHNTLAGYVQHPTHRDIKPGDYTDDTQMTLAIAELMCDGALWSAEVIADRFVEVYRRDERDGYSRTTRALLRESTSGAQLIAGVSPGKDHSGAAMRVAPLGLLPDIRDVLRHAELQARVTHDSDSAVEAAQAAALAVHYCHRRLGPTRSVTTWIDDQLGGSGRWSARFDGPVGKTARVNVQAALTALASHDRLSDLLLACVAFTGDVDTVATIALAAGSRAADVEQDLPEQLYATLENGPFGRDYLAELDRRLLSRYG
jgi:ADP-ribosylglycohydrolase